MPMEISSSCFLTSHKKKQAMNESESWEGLDSAVLMLIQDLGQVCPVWRLHMMSLGIMDSQDPFLIPGKNMCWFMGCSVRHLLSTPSLCVQSTQDIYDAQIICSASLTFPRCVRVNVNVQSCFSHVPCIYCRFLHIWQPYWRNFSSQEKSSQIVESPLRSIKDFPVKEKLPRHMVILPRNSYPCSPLSHPFPEILDYSGAYQSTLMFRKPCFCAWFQILCRVGTQIPHFSFFTWIYFKKEQS